MCKIYKIKNKYENYTKYPELNDNLPEFFSLIYTNFEQLSKDYDVLTLKWEAVKAAEEEYMLCGCRVRNQWMNYYTWDMPSSLILKYKAIDETSIRYIKIVDPDKRLI